MALGAWFLNSKKDKKKECVSTNKMYFYIGDSKFCRFKSFNSSFYLAEDSSLLYDGLQGDYSVLLGGNWRFELIVDSETGLCTHM